MQTTFKDLLRYARFLWASVHGAQESNEHVAPTELVYELRLPFRGAVGVVR